MQALLIAAIGWAQQFASHFGCLAVTKIWTSV